MAWWNDDWLNMSSLSSFHKYYLINWKASTSHYIFEIKAFCGYCLLRNYRPMFDLAKPKKLNCSLICFSNWCCVGSYMPGDVMAATYAYLIKKIISGSVYPIPPNLLDNILQTNTFCIPVSEGKHQFRLHVKKHTNLSLKNEYFHMKNRLKQKIISDIPMLIIFGM